MGYHWPSLDDYFLKGYIDKEIYLNNYSKDELIGMEIEDQFDNTNEFKEHVLVNPPAKWRSSSWKITFKSIAIWDLWIEIELRDYEYCIADFLHHSKFKICSDAAEVAEIPFVVNCFMAHMMDRKIIETSSSIKIPLELLTLFRINKLPIHEDNITIIMDLHDNYDSGEQILHFKSERIYTKEIVVPLHIFESYLVFYEKGIYHFASRAPCHFLIFDVSIHNKQIGEEEAILQEIHLSINDTNPIIYLDIFDEIISFTIYGKKIYAISLCPEFKNISCIKHSFRNKIFLNKISGINFNWDDSSNIKFVFDTIIHDKSICYQICSDILEKKCAVLSPIGF